jgi:hypothetical protein
MIDKLIEKIQLDRPSVFWGIVLVMYLVSITATKYFYYESKVFSEERRLKSLYGVIDEAASTCMDLKKQDGKYCLQKLSPLLDRVDAYYGQKVSVSGMYGTLLHGDPKYAGERDPLNLSTTMCVYAEKKEQCIQNGQRIESLDSQIEITSYPKPELYKSVILALTFSAEDMLNNKFNIYRAMSRSLPAYFQLFLVILAVSLLRLSVIAKMRYIQKHRESDEFDD